MADNTKIEWTDATLNVVNGCSVVSPGCTNCYAMRSGGRNLPGHPSTGLTMPSKAGHVWTGEVRFNETALMLPLRWKRPRMIFWNAHGDLFHESVPDEWIDRQFAVMALTPLHTHQVLTKRSSRMREYMNGPWQGRLFTHLRELQVRPEGHGAMLETVNGVLPNVWLGVSVEDQTRADERIPDLRATPAAVRWISAEPLLGPVDLCDVAIGKRENGVRVDALTGRQWDDLGERIEGEAIDWIVVGGESGPGARPMHPDWARSLRDQCAAADVPFLFKQWGEWVGGTWHGDGEMVGFSSVDLTDDARQVEQQLSARDGARNDESWWSALHCWNDEDMPDGNGPAAFRVGKKAAGRLLDGVQHDGYPS